MVGTGHVGLQAGEGEEDVDGGEAALDVELAVKVDLVLDDVAGEVCGKMQPKVSAGTRKRRQRSPTSREPDNSAVTGPARSHVPGMGCVMSLLGMVRLGS